jgi:hypothetical protein
MREGVKLVGILHIRPAVTFILTLTEINHFLPDKDSMCAL